MAPELVMWRQTEFSRAPSICPNGMLPDEINSKRDVADRRLSASLLLRMSDLVRHPVLSVFTVASSFV
jgi:hypothetical protein